jgi:hypothetical protein
MEMDGEILLPSGPFNFEELYSPHFLWFKINSSSFQACLFQGPNTGRGGGGNHRPPNGVDQLFPPGNRQDLTFGSLKTGPKKEDEFVATRVL